VNVDRILSAVLLGVIGVAALTTVFGRKTSGPVIDALGNAFSGSISSALGKGVTL
jgi:hypothetical protein